MSKTTNVTMDDLLAEHDIQQLKAGDVVDIEITGLGTLRNPFVAEK